MFHQIILEQGDQMSPIFKDSLWISCTVQAGFNMSSEMSPD